MTMESNTKVSLFLCVPSERAIEENITGFTFKVNTVENRQKRLPHENIEFAAKTNF